MMTYYELKENILMNNPCSEFFTSLRWFGIRESESRVLCYTIDIKGTDGHTHTCYILSERQRNAPKGVSQRHYTFWDISTFKEIFPSPVQ